MSCINRLVEGDGSGLLLLLLLLLQVLLLLEDALPPQEAPLAASFGLNRRDLEIDREKERCGSVANHGSMGIKIMVTMGGMHNS